MAGGKGSRMKTPTEKLLLTYKKPVIIHVIDALYESNCFEKIFALTSPKSPQTQDYLQKKGIELFLTRGEGFSKDLNEVLTQIDDDVLVTSGDLPFLDGQIIKQIVSRYNPFKLWTSFVVTKGFLDSLGLSSDFPVIVEEGECFYTGISLINSKKIKTLDFVKESHEILDDKRVAFNLNTKQDYDLVNVS